MRVRRRYRTAIRSICKLLLDVRVDHTSGADDVVMEEKTGHVRRYPLCKQILDIVPLDESYPCPKCGATMVRDEESGILWD